MRPFPSIALRLVASTLMATSLTGCLGGGSPNSNPVDSSTSPIPIEDRSTVGDTTAKADTQQDGSAAPSQAELSKSNVTLALVDKSNVARRQGNLNEAVTHIERAIRINPRRADLWVQLAQLQLALDAPSVAEGYARKAISLAGSRIDWKRDAWLVIADAKQAQGQTGEADAIRQRWRTAQG